VDKAGVFVGDSDELTLVEMMPYVSRGGYKLAGALDAFTVDVSDAVCADVGACTGGFTDVLLQTGAAKVYAIDVGYGQLDWKLRQDERVVVIERTNARYIEDLDEPIDFVVIDVSFISLRLILPAVAQWLKENANVVALIKPQFEASKKEVGKGGIIRDDEIRRNVVINLLEWIAEHSWKIDGLIQSPIQGADGNIEYLVHLSNRSEGEGLRPENLISDFV
ncbi:MAG: TlyA family RNA methyltransferase, partial [Chloroflexota bacterium]